MSDVQLSIIVPISSEDLGDLSTVDIIKALKSYKEIEGLKRKLLEKKFVVNNFGTSLDLILDEVVNPFDRAQALRQLAKNMKEWHG